jgi:hypothetical protein
MRLSLRDTMKLVCEAKDFAVGDIVIAKKGPHKGEKHEIIHIHGDDDCNVRPVGKKAKDIKYKLGAAKAKPEDLEYPHLYKESLDEAKTKEALEDYVDSICTCDGGECLDPSEHEKKCPARAYLKDLNF